MVEISLSGSGEGPGGAIPWGYSTAHFRPKATPRDGGRTAAAGVLLGAREVRLAGQIAPNPRPAGAFSEPRAHRGPARLSRATLDTRPYATESASLAERRSTRLFQ